VITQVTETIASDTISFSSTMNELGNRQLTLEINPPELGRLEIKIDSAENILTAHIIASESITSEMLTREKSQLIEALKEQGIDLPDVNISYRNSREQNQSENQSNRDEAGRFSNSRIAPRSAANPTSQIPYLVNSDPSRINLVA
jgi:flagellar hook-length control protein FliK